MSAKELPQAINAINSEVKRDQSGLAREKQTHSRWILRWALKTEEKCLGIPKGESGMNKGTETGKYEANLKRNSSKASTCK